MGRKNFLVRRAEGTREVVAWSPCAGGRWGVWCGESEEKKLEVIVTDCDTAITSDLPNECLSFALWPLRTCYDPLELPNGHSACIEWLWFTSKLVRMTHPPLEQSLKNLEWSEGGEKEKIEKHVYVERLWSEKMKIFKRWKKTSDVWWMRKRTGTL